MHSEVITGLNGAIYHGQTYFQPGPWNQPLHCPNNTCHIHYGHGLINLKHSPYYSQAYSQPQYIGSLVPNVPGTTTVFHAHSRNTLELSIEKAIDGEYSAISCYQKLINLAPSTYVKDKIIEIRNDEMRHFRTFSSLYSQLTGKEHTPKISEECPKNYKHGLDFAFKDEQETVDFYLGIASNTDNPRIKDEFLRAAP